jgi:DNA-binding transcriptional MerR regulator
MAANLTIGRLAQATGCKVPTIRYYEQVALLPAPRRSAGNQRLYGPEHVARLTFIRNSRHLGLSLASIREVLGLATHPEQPCEKVTQVVQAHLDEVKRRINQLRALEAELERMIVACRGDLVADCRIIRTLADQSPGHCIAHHQ